MKLLLFKLARWLKEPQDKYREALEQGFNVEFYHVVPVKRAVEDNSPESKRPTKALKQAKFKPANDKGGQGSSNEAPNSDHPSNKCAGCGNKFEWQRAQNLPVCSKSAVLQATSRRKRPYRSARLHNFSPNPSN